MATALVNIFNKENIPIRCRMLLDSAATLNLITERLAQKLDLPKHQIKLSVGGLGTIQTTTSHNIKATIQSRYNQFEKTLEFYTVPEITGQHPTNYIQREGMEIPDDINLADPSFHIPGDIDLLIGTGPTLSTILTGNKNLSPIQGPDLHMINTHLGWIIGGEISLPNKIKKNKSQIICHVTTTQALRQLTKTWEIEEGPKTKHWSAEEIACEAHYKEHVTKHSDGKYTVALPFNSKKSLLGETRRRALSRLESLEERFKRQPGFKEQYSAIIQEYLDLGYMERCQEMSPDTEGFYLPHHAVIKESSLTTKVRVVFDGSAKSTTGVSLNDTLMVGPTIQEDIISHLIRFRLHVFVITGDIEKMYLQTWIQPADRKYQKILWRDKNGEIKDYQLKTVTFGLASAPFLAIRSIQQLVEDEGDNHPIATETLKRDMYVDDYLSGANTIEEGLANRNDVEQILRKAQLNIRQWASNDPRLLEGLPEEKINSKLSIENNPILKTLGLRWQSQSDSICYSINNLPTQATMRIILTEIAKIFDPLGILGPIIITARLIFQECWKQRVTWDQPLPITIRTAWTNFATEFNSLKEITINRGAIPPQTTNIQLHGFADASERAYGAYLYLRCITSTGETHTRLLCAKGKIAPLKNVTLARLELCAALMLANLYETVKDRSSIEISKTIFWSDSTITLHWINTPSYQLKTFVANRVAEIQTKTSISQWRHIRSNDNPADALLRGQSPTEFLTNSLWNSGPPWINKAESFWPDTPILVPAEDPEKKKILCLSTCIKPESLDDSLIKNFKTTSLLHRVIARLLRLRPNNQHKGECTIQELQDAECRIIKLIQSIAFPKELHNLKHKQSIPENSRLKHLSPFLDENGILRVGGRLKHAAISYNQQHPMILPQSHPYTTLVIQDAHSRRFHAGAQTTLYTVRRKFWPLNGPSEAKKVTRQCHRCIRSKPHTSNYPMGELPEERVTQARPFYHTGVDYCGPFFVKEKENRNRGRVKVYVAVFICMVTKAVHLEIVSDLTTDGFIAALRRFIARRGKPYSIHSDNGTNFIGANNQLKELYEQLHSEEHQTKIHRYLAEEGIEWKFIPARSPNFGGLWEAAVKSYKHHMIRIVGETLYSYEELHTFATEIEAILNSRPITPASSDPNDPIALTPGHFLIGTSLTSIPDWDWTDVPSNRLSAWQQIQQMKQAFWKRWHKDYLNGLNTRHKWTKGHHEIKKDTVVIIKDDNTRPLRWPLGRVIKVHPGADGIIRTVTIKTSTGIIDRNVRNLAILLPEDEDK